MFYGKDARVVQEAHFDEDLKCPQRFFRDRVGGRPVADYRTPGYILEQFLGPPHVILEFRPALLKNHLMVQAMAADLMTSSVDLLDKGREPLGDPAKHKECRLRRPAY